MCHVANIKHLSNCERGFQCPCASRPWRGSPRLQGHHAPPQGRTPTHLHPQGPLKQPERTPVSLGCRTTSASKPTTVSRPLESADTAYMVVSLEKPIKPILGALRSRQVYAGRGGRSHHSASRLSPHLVLLPFPVVQYKPLAGRIHTPIQAERWSGRHCPAKLEVALSGFHQHRLPPKLFLPLVLCVWCVNCPCGCPPGLRQLGKGLHVTAVL